jgi:ribonuclease HII
MTIDQAMVDGVVGIDEVGRGCWAGPLVAAAVLLQKPISGLKDSKKLSPRQRERLAATIRVEAAAVGLGWVAPKAIDQNGLTWAVAHAMSEALSAIDTEYSHVIIDGSYNFIPDNPKVSTLVKADATIMAVSAASILAKVVRDKYMYDQAARFPNHHFDKHVGYGTALHRQMIADFGVTELHRLSYKPLHMYRTSP